MKIPCLDSTSHTQKRGKITKNKVRKSNRFKHLEGKLLKISYLSIKSGTLKDTRSNPTDRVSQKM